MRRASMAFVAGILLVSLRTGPVCAQIPEGLPATSTLASDQPMTLPEVTLRWPSAENDPASANPRVYAPGDFSQILKRLEDAEGEIRALRAKGSEQGKESDVNLIGYQEPGVFPTRPTETPAAGDKPVPAAKSDFPTFKITGFTQLDGGWFSQDPQNMATVGNMQDGVGFRRARLAVVGKAAEFTNYMFEIDFATAGRPSFFDMWAEQANLPYLGTLRAGQYVQPFSVDAMSGFRHLMFLERSLPFFAFVPFRRVGVEAFDSSDDERTNWGYSVFRTGGFNNAPLGDSRFADDFGDVGGYSFSTRLTQLVYYDEAANDRYLWHIGGSYDYSRLGANSALGSASPVPFYQARTTPEFFLGFAEAVPATFGPATAFAGTPIFVDTGRYEASSFNLFGVETVYQSGPTSVQAEWMGTVVDSAVGPIFYHGAYAQVAYRLTGEHRVYYKKLAALGNVVPFTDFISLKPGGIVGWGAWEVAARWSYVDLRNPASLNGHYLAGTSAVGNGTLNDSTIGATWFLNANTKIQFNWIHAMLENKVKGFSDADLFVSRLQLSF
jgi:phosphate-selective porin OprO and OprP